jgi:POT family proton-dependent oligopeptide transporter
VATVDATKPPAKTSHPLGFLFFFWGEFAERSSYYGMRAILSLYMTEKLGVDKADAGTFMSLFIAGCYFLPLLGGWLADNFFGKYWTIVLFSIPYVIGQYIVGIEDKYVVVGALALLAMGSGVIKPNISTLMGMTYDQQRPGQEQLRSNAFSWFYLAINIGALMSQFLVPWLRTEYSYQTAFLFPCFSMGVALAFFALGKRYYAKEVLERKVVGTPGETIPDGRTLTGLPVHYKVVTPEEKAADRALKLQTLGRIGSLFLLIMFFWAIFDQSASTWIFFADTYMDLHIFGLEASADQLQLANALFIVTCLPLSVVFFNRMAANGVKIRATDKMVVGFVLTALSMLILAAAGSLAGKKQEVVKLTLPEGVVYLKPAAMALDKVEKPASGTATVAFGDVKVVAGDWAYDAEKKKLTFADGKLVLADGKGVAVANGHVGSPGPDGAALAAGGALETKFKTGDTLAKVKPDPAKATFEMADWVEPSQRVTAWWKILAFFVLTLGEILISVTGLELAFVAAPPTMKSFVTACWLVTVGMANLFINAPITRLYPKMEPGVYFLMLAGALVVVTVLFVPLAARFNRGMAAAAAAEANRIKEGDTETV